MIKTLRSHLAAALLAVPCLATAHVVLLQPQATAGASYRAAFVIGHGCDGAPVHGVTVTLPEGVRGARPMPKPGWTLTLRKQALAQPYSRHGTTVTEDVVAVRWTAQPPAAWLQDGWTDEFVLHAQLPAQPGPLWFPVRQDCEPGSIDWAERPAAGTATTGLRRPAVLLQVQPAAAPDGHHHH